MEKNVEEQVQIQQSMLAKIADRFRAVVSSCPYVMAGRKIREYVRSDTAKPVTATIPPTNRERDIQTRIRIGKAVALIGFFCPLFWISLLSGNRGPELYFNAAHSGIVILIGLGYMAKCRTELEREKRNRSISKRIPSAVITQRRQ